MAAPAAPPALPQAAPAPIVTPAPPTAPSVAASEPAPTPPAAPVQPPPPPEFDVVRVEPTGDAVIAGKAQPGATVELMRNGSRHDRVVADASGLFVLTPPPLPPGEHELTLRFSTPDGLQVVSRQSVVVSISPTRSERPMIVVTAPDQPSVILSMPERATPERAPPGTSAAAVPETPAGTIAIATVEAEGGRLFVSGRGVPSSSVRLYLNESYLASGNADREGRLDFVIERGLPPGDYRVRLDAVDVATGTVKSRAEVTFVMPATPLAAAPAPPVASTTAAQSAPGLPAAPAIAAREPAAQQPAASAPAGASQAPIAAASPTQVASASPLVVVEDVRTATVSRGDSLWRISRRLYGQGVRYTVIYAANQDQIRDPDRIYPGQVFVLPQARP
jgi:nucleoid-associated protein YgaU